MARMWCIYNKRMQTRLKPQLLLANGQSVILKNANKLASLLHRSQRPQCSKKPAENWDLRRETRCASHKVYTSKAISRTCVRIPRAYRAKRSLRREKQSWRVTATITCRKNPAFTVREAKTCRKHTKRFA